MTYIHIMLEFNIYTILIFVFLLIIFGLVSFNAYKIFLLKNGIYTSAGMNLQIPSTKEHFRLYTCPGIYANPSMALQCNSIQNNMKAAKMPLYEIEEARRMCC